MRPGLERYQKYFIANMMLAESNCTNAIDPDKKKKYRLQQPADECYRKEVNWRVSEVC